MAPVNKSTPKTGVNGTKKKRGGEQGEFTLKRVKGQYIQPCFIPPSSLPSALLPGAYSPGFHRQPCPSIPQVRISTSMPPAPGRRSSSTVERPFATETERLPRLLLSRRVKRMLPMVELEQTRDGSVSQPPASTRHRYSESLAHLEAINPRRKY